MRKTRIGIRVLCVLQKVDTIHDTLIFIEFFERKTTTLNIKYIYMSELTLQLSTQLLHFSNLKSTLAYMFIYLYTYIPMKAMLC